MTTNHTPNPIIREPQICNWQLIVKNYFNKKLPIIMGMNAHNMEIKAITKLEIKGIFLYFSP